jgi:8-oxo-dGTP pyrophosphatase MutT (NUDIX family)
MSAPTSGGPEEPSGVQPRDVQLEPGQELNLDVHSGPGQQHNPGPPTAPRQAATVILLRGDAHALEVLLVQRTPKARFMGGVWVFPGGAVDGEDGDGDRDNAHRTAAIRELREEASVVIDDPTELVAFSRWITPEQVQIRFDTHFFLAELPRGQEPAVDGHECVDLGWFAPRTALQTHADGELELVFPTIKHLEQLGEFASVESLMSYARGRDVQPVQPRVLLEGEVARIVLPGEPGY